MKTLYLVRHAKSEWENEELADIDRPLNARGYRDAHEMGKRIKLKGIMPGLIIASAAIRTTSTALIIAREIGYAAGDIRLVPEMYHAPQHEYEKAISVVPDEVEKLMVVCHNPTITEYVNYLCGPVTDTLFTCSVVGIAIDSAKWRGIKKGKLLFIDYPKNSAG